MDNNFVDLILCVKCLASHIEPPSAFCSLYPTSHMLTMFPTRSILRTCCKRML